MLPSGQKKTGVFAKGGKAFHLGSHTPVVADVIAGEPVYIETSEKQQEESVITLTISKSSLVLVYYITVQTHVT